MAADTEESDLVDATDAPAAVAENEDADDSGDSGWEMADGDGQTGGAERILNQDEIDSLLGLDRKSVV